jgi:Domain of unknown function (DUF5655)
VTEPRPLWTCPRCGVKLVTRNQWHSCGNATLDDWLGRVGPRGQGLYDAFTAVIAACGEYHVAPAKTRIAFLARVRFATISRLTDDEMVCGFALPWRVQSPRFVRVKEEVPGWWAHSLRVTLAGELDDEVRSWVAESYRLMGMQERLR